MFKFLNNFFYGYTEDLDDGSKIEKKVEDKVEELNSMLRTDFKGRTALHNVCCSYNKGEITIKPSLEIIKKILEKERTLINLKDSEGDTPLHYICYDKYDLPEIAEFLIKNGADLRAINKYGNTPLRCSILKGNQEVTKVILDKME